MGVLKRSRLHASLLGIALAAAAVGLGCEKDVREVRRRSVDPYAAIRGAPMGYTSAPGTGVRGTPSPFGGDITSGARAAPSAPRAQPRASAGGVTIAPGGDVSAGPSSAISPIGRAGARVPGAAVAAPGGAPASIGGNAWSPTDR